MKPRRRIQSEEKFVFKAYVGMCGVYVCIIILEENKIRIVIKSKNKNT